MPWQNWPFHWQAGSIGKIGGSMGAGMDEFRQRHERFEFNGLGIYQLVSHMILLTKSATFLRIVL
jgi:hypothetical protein